MRFPATVDSDCHLCDIQVRVHTLFTIGHSDNTSRHISDPRPVHCMRNIYPRIEYLCFTTDRRLTDCRAVFPDGKAPQATLAWWQDTAAVRQTPLAVGPERTQRHNSILSSGIHLMDQSLTAVGPAAGRPVRLALYLSAKTI